MRRRGAQTRSDINGNFIVKREQGKNVRRGRARFLEHNGDKRNDQWHMETGDIVSRW